MLTQPYDAVQELKREIEFTQERARLADGDGVAMMDTWCNAIAYAMAIVLTERAIARDGQAAPVREGGRRAFTSADALAMARSA